MRKLKPKSSRPPSVRIELDKAWAAERLLEWGYPHDWNHQDLERCFVLTVKGDKALLWFHWWREEGTAQLHIATSPKARKAPWLLQSVLDDVTYCLRLIAAREVVAVLPDAPLIPLLTRLGFEDDNGIYRLPLYGKESS